jgi:NADPH:quinone reductase-like Zn-dependent oxidoreductase
MYAIRLSEPGGPDALRYQEVPTPRAGPGQALVRLRAAALNHRDLRIRRGDQPQPLPLILGADGAGTVAHVGEGVVDVQVGDEVVINPGLSDDSCAYCQRGLHSLCEHFRILGGPEDGTYAQFVLVPAANLHRKPSGLSWEEAAAFPLAALTAWHLLISRARVQPAETVLILGIGGGVATYALQVARLAGATVFVTSSSDEKLERARELGAAAGINYTRQDWTQQALELTDGRGVDVVFETVGTATWRGSLQSVAKGGRIAICGGTTGGELSTNLSAVLRRQISIVVSYMGDKGEFADVVRTFERGQMRSLVDRVFPLSETAASHAYLEAGSQMGKVVLAIPE